MTQNNPPRYQTMDAWPNLRIDEWITWLEEKGRGDLLTGQQGAFLDLLMALKNYRAEEDGVVEIDVTGPCDCERGHLRLVRTLHCSSCQPAVFLVLSEKVSGGTCSTDDEPAGYE